MSVAGPSPPSRPPSPPVPQAPLRRAARELESAFLAEMLKSAGLGEARGAFGGGPGEAQFASFLRRRRAEAIAASGATGLSEQLFESLKERADARI